MLDILNNKEYEWIKNSEVYLHIDDLENNKNTPTYPLKFNDIQDFKNIIETIDFWEVRQPYPYEFSLSPSLAR